MLAANSGLYCEARHGAIFAEVNSLLSEPWPVRDTVKVISGIEESQNAHIHKNRDVIEYSQLPRSETPPSWEATSVLWLL